MIKPNRLLGGVLGAVLALLSCSQGDTTLTPQKAKEIIRTSGVLGGNDETFAVEIPSFTVRQEPTQTRALHALESIGYVTLAVKDRDDQGREEMDISVTEKGAAPMRGWQSKSTAWTIPIAHWELVEVTDVHVEARSAKVTFNYRWAQTEIGAQLTAMGAVVAPTDQGDAQAYFALYDDGWRLADRTLIKRGAE